MEEKNLGNYRHLHASIQQALLYEIGPNLRGVAYEWKNEKVLLFFYHEGIMTSELIEKYSDIAAQVIANYDEPVTIDEKVISLPSIKSFPNHAHWAYQR
jgi:hypothetical protein